MYGGGRRGISQEEGGGRDNNGNNTDNTDNTDGTDSTDDACVTSRWER